MPCEPAWPSSPEPATAFPLFRVVRRPKTYSFWSKFFGLAGVARFLILR